MQGWRTARDHRLATSLLVCALCVFRTGNAQQTAPPTLDEVLQQLETNLHQYDSQVPSFLCDEHVVSQAVPIRVPSTVTDSVFRLKRNVMPNHTITLDESRDIKTVNGRPAKGEGLNGPSILSGAFSGGLAIVSLSQTGCMSYKLKPIKPDHPGDPYIVEFATVPKPEHPSECLLQEDSSGRVLIDPGAMQIKRMELTAPHHSLALSGTTLDGRPVPPVTGVWAITVDYAPIQLGGRTFWMPSTITSNMTVRGPIVWSFKAQYANYHKLQVTSRIVPSTEEPAP